MPEKPTTRNIKACSCQCVQAAKEMHLPLRTALDVFEGEPTKLLLTMAKRVQELELESVQEDEDFDPVRYVTGAAKHRGWGKYAPKSSITLDLSSVDEEVRDTIGEMLQDTENVNLMNDFLTHAAQIYKQRKEIREGHYAEAG